MNETLQSIVEKIKDSPFVQSKPELSHDLSRINKYADNEEERAYLLGYLLRKSALINEFPPEFSKALHDTLKSQGIDDYYYLKSKPDNEHLGTLSLVLLIGGLCAMILGIIQLFNGTVTTGVNLRYLTFVVRNGGYKVVLGAVLLTGGFIRYNHERKKRQFINKLRSC
jgi:hypothetical protein